jgi:hypothetical protein
MPFPLHILATDDDTGTAFKILFGVIVVMFWIIKAVMSAVSQNKKPTPTRRGQPPRQPLSYGGNMALQQQQRRQQQRPARIPPRNVPQVNPRAQQQRPYPPRLVQPQSVPAPLRAQVIDPASTGSRPAPKTTRPSTADAARVARLLRRPDSLRAALILNEVLGPPVSLRPASPSRQI